MKRYFKNLLLALLSRNPFLWELNEIREHYERAAERVCALTDLYYRCVDNMEKTSKQLFGYQKLIENYRQRLEEKDELMARMKKDYQQRIEAYCEEINKLSVKSNG